jgi:hypothetical protein
MSHGRLLGCGPAPSPLQVAALLRLGHREQRAAPVFRQIQPWKSDLMRVFLHCTTP